MNQPFFLMQNNHTPASGTPPCFRNESPSLYCGYFENELGEQSVFVYDRESKKGELRGGDAGWQEVFPIIDGQPDKVGLRADESAWLKLCWRAATGKP